MNWLIIYRSIGGETSLPNAVLSLKGGELTITRAHAMGFVGQHVVLRTSDGTTHHGILQSVTSDGIYVRAVDRRGTRLANDTDANTSGINLLQNLPQPVDDTREAFFPFLFFPFFALAFLWPWGWWW